MFLQFALCVIASLVILMILRVSELSTRCKSLESFVATAPTKEEMRTYVSAFVDEKKTDKKKKHRRPSVQK
jgi:hypothetical protein